MIYLKLAEDFNHMQIQDNYAIQVKIHKLK